MRFSGWMMGCVLVLQASSALAGTNAKEAARLQNILQAQVDAVAAVRKTDGGLEVFGKVSVIQDREQYNVVLPDMHLRLDAARKLAVGGIKLGLVPDETGVWRVGIRLPEKMDVLDASRQVIGRVSLGKQSMGGLWHEKVGNFIQYAMTVDKIRLTTNDGMQMDLEALQGVRNMQRDEKGLWSGQDKLNMSGFHVRESGKPDLLRIGHVEAITSMNLFDLEKIRGLSSELQSSLARTPDKALTEEEISQVVLSFFSKMADLVGGGALQMDVRDISFQDPETGTGVDVDNLAFGLAATALASPQSGLRMTYAQKGVAMHPPMAEPDIVPHEMSLTINASRLPLRMILKTWMDMLGQVAILPQGEARQALMTKAEDVIHARMVKEGTTFDAKLAGVFGDVDIKGAVHGTTSDVSPARIEGAATLRISGLEDLVAAASRTVISDPSHPVVQLLPFLASMQASALQEMENGKPVDMFKVELGPDGVPVFNENPAAIQRPDGK